MDCCLFHFFCFSPFPKPRRAPPANPMKTYTFPMVSWGVGNQEMQLSSIPVGYCGVLWGIVGYCGVLRGVVTVYWMIPTTNLRIYVRFMPKRTVFINFFGFYDIYDSSLAPTCAKVHFPRGEPFSHSGNLKKRIGFCRVRGGGRGK